MEKKNIAFIAVGVLIVAAFLGIATVKIVRDRKPAPEDSKVEQPEEKPAPERRHGPRVHKKVDIASTFSGVGGMPQDGDRNAEQDGEPQKELSEQTPEEAVEAMWQGLETYREMSDEDRAKADFMMVFVTGIISGLAEYPQEMLRNMNEQQRAEAITKAQAVLANIDAIEEEVSPDMTEDELNIIGGILQSVRKLSTNLLDAAQ